MTRGSLRFIWGVPALLAAATTFGLAAALLGTGAWRWAAWGALALPIAACARHGLRRQRRDPAS